MIISKGSNQIGGTANKRSRKKIGSFVLLIITGFFIGIQVSPEASLAIRVLDFKNLETLYYTTPRIESSKPTLVSSTISFKTAGDTRYSILTFTSPRTYPLHSLTAPNKLRFAEKHNYSFVIWNVSDADIDANFTFTACPLIEETFEMSKDVSWMFIIGADHVFTNLGVRLEDVINSSMQQRDDIHFITSADGNLINNGAYFVRNSIKGRAFLRTMCASKDLLVHHGWYEQNFLIEIFRGDGHLKKIMDLAPGRTFNSFPPELIEKGPELTLDIYGCDSVFHEGDFIVHFPGHPDEKISFAKRYLSEVIDEPRSVADIRVCNSSGAGNSNKN